MPLTIVSDAHGIRDKEQAKILRDDDCRSFRRWGWLLANEPSFQLVFRPGSENIGADLLSRKGKYVRVKARGGKALEFDLGGGEPSQSWIPGQGEFFVQSNSVLSVPQMVEIIWKEHRVAHLGAWKVFKSLRRRDIKIPLKLIQRTLRNCKTCVQFREDRPRDEWHPLLQSLEPGGVVYVDVIGPLPPGRGGVEYI